MAIHTIRFSVGRVVTFQPKLAHFNRMCTTRHRHSQRLLSLQNDVADRTLSVDELTNRADVRPAL